MRQKSLHIRWIRASLPLGAGFVLLAHVALGVAPHSVAIHTFTVGVIGCAIVAIITRTARGHTGRPLVGGPVEIACTGLIVVAALIRVLGPWLMPPLTMDWIVISGLCWAAALFLYCVRYAPWLCLARADGKSG
ncbi:MAG TPA: NnrS family protein [Paraburkholderia sp.]|uniref:NnrS family protein n=1 Tax=Paraburkholderia sp. TaxID=1926495 RepID=UPI002ED3D635